MTDKNTKGNTAQRPPDGFVRCCLNKSRPALLNEPDGILYSSSQGDTIDYELFKLSDVADDYVMEEFNVICADDRLKV